ncbi:GH25135 [Drosophila grimshawi]|uniref:GH25135 n=1 Tax=Drosophila grimshawi TaxID=7222 RepID=B4JZG2_DROGR|nr:GH25135 [Drosophila grimshawi]
MNNAGNKDSIQEAQGKQVNPNDVLLLPDAELGETETDAPDALQPRQVSFDPTLERQRLSEAQTLVKDMIETMLPQSESEPQHDAEVTITEQPMSTAQLCHNDERLQRILRLLDRYTRNLEAIEEHVRSRETGARTAAQQLDDGTELQLTQHCELATQTLPLNSLRLDVTSTIRPKSSDAASCRQQQQQQHQQPQQQQQQQQQLPPCERRYHTITISTNSSAAFAARPQPVSVLGRMWRALYDFAAACCLCLQVNKDCLFCLGFFLAFVISASFLTAFFYRTINLTQPAIRVPVEAMETHAALGTPSTGNMVTVRFNGGYYYIYNHQRQHFV